MPTHTPATALAAVLNALWMLSLDANRSAESWRVEVQKILDTARPFSNMLLDRESTDGSMDKEQVDHEKTESEFMAQLRRDGQAEVGVFDEVADTYRMVTVVYDHAAPRLTANHYQALLSEGVGRIGPHEPITYVLNGNNTFFPVLSNPDHGPLTDEEVEIMMREGWGDGRSCRVDRRRLGTVSGTLAVPPTSREKDEKWFCWTRSYFAATEAMYQVRLSSGILKLKRSLVRSVTDR